MAEETVKVVDLIQHLDVMREFMMECMKEKDEEIRELKSKLYQHDRIINVLICDTKNLRHVIKEENRDNDVLSNTGSGREVTVEMLCDVFKMVEEFYEVKVRMQNNEGKQVELAKECASNFKILNNIKRKVDDECEKIDDFNKTLKKVKRHVEEHDVRIVNNCQELTECKKESQREYEILQTKIIEMDKINRKVHELINEIKNIDRNVEEINVKFENSNKLINGIRNDVTILSDSYDNEKIKLNNNIKSVDSTLETLAKFSNNFDDINKKVKDLIMEVKIVTRNIQELNVKYETTNKTIIDLTDELSEPREQEKTKLFKHIEEAGNTQVAVAKYEQSMAELQDIINMKNKEINTLKSDVAILNMSTSIKAIAVEEIKTEIRNALRNEDWRKCVQTMEKNIPEQDILYEQLQNMKGCKYLPLAAAERGYVELIQVLLCNGLQTNYKMGYNEKAMLHKAAWCGKNNVVELLVSHGADIEARDSEGYTPLHCAIYKGHASTAQLLVDMGANINITDNQGWAPLHNAACNGSVTIVQLLIDKGASVNTINKEGDTPLHLSAWYGNALVAQCLLDNKCNKQIKNIDGKTALDVAREGKYNDVINILDK